MKEPQVGDVVVYHDEVGQPKNALVTCNWGGGSLNVVFVSSDAGMKDQYGRQIGRETSVSHVTVQQAHGRYWRWPDEEPKKFVPPVST